MSFQYREAGKPPAWDESLIYLIPEAAKTEKPAADTGGVQAMDTQKEDEDDLYGGL